MTKPVPQTQQLAASGTRKTSEVAAGGATGIGGSVLIAHMYPGMPAEVVGSVASVAAVLVPAIFSGLRRVVGASESKYMKAFLGVS